MASSDSLNVLSQTKKRPSRSRYQLWWGPTPVSSETRVGCTRQGGSACHDQLVGTLGPAELLVDWRRLVCEVRLQARVVDPGGGSLQGVVEPPHAAVLELTLGDIGVGRHEAQEDTDEDLVGGWGSRTHHGSECVEQPQRVGVDPVLGQTGGHGLGVETATAVLALLLGRLTDPVLHLGGQDGLGPAGAVLVDALCHGDPPGSCRVRSSAGDDVK